MTNQIEDVQTEEPTLTIGDTTYPVSELSDEVKEMLSLHEQAVQMSVAAKRQATIHDLAVANIASLIEKKVTETEE
jgi:ribosomal protein S3